MNNFEVEISANSPPRLRLPLEICKKRSKLLSEFEKLIDQETFPRKGKKLDDADKFV